MQEGVINWIWANEILELTGNDLSSNEFFDFDVIEFSLGEKGFLWKGNLKEVSIADQCRTLINGDIPYSRCYYVPIAKPYSYIYTFGMLHTAET